MRTLGFRRTLSEELNTVLYAEHCEIALSGTGEVPKIKWLNVAKEGEYRGHWQGQFALTRAVFNSFVKNLRAHPQFKLGPVEVGGKTITAGSQPTIQFDFEHASEQGPTQGSIPELGAPAPAWALDLEVRDGADGKAQLWALAQLGDRIRGYIGNDEYRQTSIAFNMQGVDFETREAIGPTLTSIAFTNNPFLRNLESIAASRRSGQPQLAAIEPTVSGVAPLESPNGDPDMNAEALKKAYDKLRARLCSALKVTTLAADDDLADAVEGATAGAAAGTELAADLGVDMGAAKQAIADLMSMKAEHEAALAEIASILDANASADMAVAEQDVAQIMAANQWQAQPGMGMALSARRALVVSEHLKTVKPLNGAKTLSVGQVINETQVGRQKFMTEYGIKPPGEAGAVDVATLTSSLVAARGGQQLAITPKTPAPVTLSAVPGAPLPGAAGAAPVALPIDPRTAEGAAGVVDVRHLAGRNPTEQLITHLKNTQPGFAAQPWLQQCRQASAFKKTHQIQA